MRLLATTAVTLASLMFLPSAGQCLEIEIKNFRLTYGEGGAARSRTELNWKTAEVGRWLKEQEDAARLAPEIIKGDNVCVAFEVQGCTKSDARYEVLFQLYDSKSSRIREVRRAAQTLSDGQQVSLQLPIRWWYVGTWGGSQGIYPGKYVVRIIVSNKASSKEYGYID